MPNMTYSALETSVLGYAPYKFIVETDENGRIKLVVWLTTWCGHISERRRRCRVRITNGRIQVLHLLPGLVPDGDVRRVSFIRRRRVCKQLRYRSTRAGPAVRAHDGLFLLTNKPLFHLL